MAESCGLGISLPDEVPWPKGIIGIVASVVLSPGFSSLACWPSAIFSSGFWEGTSRLPSFFAVKASRAAAACSSETVTE